MKNSSQITRDPSKRRIHGMRLMALLLVVLSSFTAQAQLSGTYTICASGCNYSSIGAAVTALQNNGVSGAVTMQIKPGDYHESVSITGISGLSSTKTLTFKGMGTAPTQVHIWDDVNSYVIQLYSISYVNLENMHVEQTYYTDYYVGLDVNSSSKCTIKNCRFTTDVNGYGYYDNNPVSVEYSTDMLFESNWFRGGWDAVNEGESVYSSGNARNVYRSNWFTKFFYNGMDTYYSDQNLYEKNYFDSGTYTYASAVNCYEESNSVYSSNNFVFRSMYYGVFLTSGSPVEFSNNLCLSVNGCYYPIYIYPYSSSAKVKFYHNTVHQSFSSGTNCAYIYNYYQAPLDIRNNIFSRSGSGVTIQHYQAASTDVFEGNNYYSTGGSIITYNGTAYSTVAAFQAAAATRNTGYTEQNINVVYKSSTDIHLDQNNIAPFGKTVGILKDVDGDARCTTYPTSGADESTYANNPNNKKITGTKFTGPTKAYIGNPTTYFNSASASLLAGYAWYVDGVKVSDSMHLRTTAFKYPSAKVKLVAYNCASKDSFEMTVTVDSPKTAPVSDFIADQNVIRQGEVVQFTDLSTGFPSTWTWDITPQSGVLNGSPSPAYKYLYGDKNSSMTRVRFDIAGKYKVCLTASNVKGTGNTECKVDYIEVVPAVTMKGGLQTVTSSQGYIYDNGGPTGPTQYYYYAQTPKTAVLIDACADSVYLTFKSMDLRCGYEALAVYEGKDANGNPLHKCKTNPLTTTYGPGFSGNLPTSCACSPMRVSGGSDTIRASKYMYMEFQNNYGTGSSNGFEAYYWTKPRTQTKPKASFTSVDSIRTNGQILYNNTTTGSDVTYLWDLDDDMSFFEATSKNTNWPYFSPGTYKITLIAMNCGGTDTFTKTITVFNPKAPITSFTADNTTPTVNDVVFFSKDMPMCVDEYKWTIKAASGPGKANYVNGTKNTSSNPQVMFTDTGCYSVTLYTKNVSGEDSLKLNCFIHVRGAYCIPTTQNKAADLGISKVVFNTINNTSPQGLTSYTNYTTDPSKSTTIEIGVTYDLSVYRTTNKNKISRTAWIDWNIDGDFDDAGEQVGNQSNSSSLEWTTQVKVPASAKTGATVLRVAVNQGTQTNTACGPNVFGEYEDYRVYVRPDATKPVITLVGKDTVRIEQCTVYSDAGATAFDNLNGNITADIKVTSTPKFDNMSPGTYIFRYNVQDGAGNQADEKRRVVIISVDKTAPNLVVEKPDTVHMDVFGTFTAPAVLLAEDCVDGDLSGDVVVTGSVNKNVIGAYTLEYSVTDGSGNTAKTTRVVVVEDKTKPTMLLLGNSTVTHEVGTTYTDADVSISDNYYSDADLRKVLVVQNNVDPNKLGTYTVVYTLTDPSGNGPVTVTRTVIVVDTQKPVATLNGDATIVMEVNTKFVDPGVTITDNYDKNLTVWDTSGTFYATFPNGFANLLGSYVITYTVSDASGNTNTVSRTVIVKDMTAPVGTLKGDLAISVCRWSNYVDAGADVSDNFDPSNKITMTPEGSFTKTWTQLEGLYSFRYKLTDQSGNVSYTDWRKILVLSPNEGGCMTGLNETSGMGKYVNVYPNPNSGKFTVKLELPKSEQVKITVTNLVGQQVAVVAEGMMNANTISVDLSAQASGVYMLNIQTATENVVKRVVINR